jgi:cysteine desulfurase
MGVYLDWNATAPPLDEVIEVMARTARDTWGNPASVHGIGRAARDVVETAREEIAALVRASARDVIFTSGGTEANNLALRNAPALVTSWLEHPSVTRVAELLEAEGRPVRWLPVPTDGRLTEDALSVALRGLPNGAVVAVSAVQHETGVIQPLGALAEVARRAGAGFHVDAVQAVGKLPAESFADAADTLSVAAHKIRGPKGIGALIHRPDRAPRPLLVGGSQERGRRPGTVDAAAAAGFRVAAGWARSAWQQRMRLAKLRDELERQLCAWGALPNGAEARRVEHVSHVSFPAHAGDELVAALDLLGVAVASGSACSAGTSEPSKAITAMVGRERARGAVRVSLGETTTEQDIEQALRAFRQVLRVQ